MTYPATWICICFLLYLALKNQKWKKRLLISGIAMTFFFTNPFFARLALNAWEVDAIPLEEIADHDIGVVFSGMTIPGDRPDDRVYFNKASDRILMAVHLYQIGRIRQILITGGKGNLTGPDRREAAMLKRFLLMLDIPEHDILLEQRADNTYQNALYTRQMLDQLPQQKRCILITSAFHMRRSVACCKKVGLEVTPFPVDYHSSNGIGSLEDIIVPSSYAMQHWRTLFHEWIGYFSYWITGKV